MSTPHTTDTPPEEIEGLGEGDMDDFLATPGHAGARRCPRRQVIVVPAIDVRGVSWNGW